MPKFVCDMNFYMMTYRNMILKGQMFNGNYFNITFGQYVL